MDAQLDLISLLALLLPMIGVFVGWGLFVHGSFIPSQTIIVASVVVFGTSLLLFVSMGNFVETRSFIIKHAKNREKKNGNIKLQEELDDGSAGFSVSSQS